MPGKRKARDVFATATTSESTKRPRSSSTKCTVRFSWRAREWSTRSKIYDNIEILQNRVTPKVLVVKKVLRASDNSAGQHKHFEIRALGMLPECNRIVNVIGYAHHYPDKEHGTAFFDFYPLGDLFHWKEAHFDDKNFKPVPESYIWRFFAQMAQAIAFIQNRLGPIRSMDTALLHRDIKPKNVLVCDNGTTYPSFKLHDFGCGVVLRSDRVWHDSRCGTFEWQPPENPKINTATAEIWALGACVHYLATGKAPIQSRTQYERDIRARFGGHPREAREYEAVDRYYAARVPREVIPINLTPDEQKTRGVAPSGTTGRAQYYPTYSDELNRWMKRTLNHRPSSRPSAMDLINNMIPEAKEMLIEMAGRTGLVDLEIQFG